MVGAGCSDEGDDTSVSIEEFKKLARSDTFRNYGPDTPEPEWEVYRNDGGIFVRQHKHSPAPNAKPPFRGDERTYVDPATVRWQQIGDGWLRGWDHGEFGGGLEWYSSDDFHHYTLSRENVRSFVEFKGRIYVLTGCNHMGHDFDCEVLKLVWNDDTGRWSAEKFADLPGVPDGSVVDDRGVLIIATSAGLVEVWPDARTRLLVPWKRWGTLQPDIEIIGSDGGLDFNSFVMAAGGDTAYIGMPQAVIEITSLKTKPKMRYFICCTPPSD
jgi:hypothetical protein